MKMKMMPMGANENDLENVKLKPMKCELNFLSKSDGSAILAEGDTVALVSVNGPLDIKTQSQSIEKCTLEILFCSKSGKPSVADRFKENVIRQTCETAVLGALYPRTGITITIQELEDYGGFLSCALNCVCLALLNAGVALRHVFASATCVADESGALRMTLDPGEKTSASLTAVFRSDDFSLITCTTEGTLDDATQRAALARCRGACDLVFAFYRDVVGNYSALI